MNWHPLQNVSLVNPRRTTPQVPGQRPLISSIEVAGLGCEKPRKNRDRRIFSVALIGWMSMATFTKMSDSRPGSVPKAQPTSAAGPPRPPKKTARGLEDLSPEGPRIDIPDPVVVKELAAVLQQKQFRIVAELM